MEYLSNNGDDIVKTIKRFKPIIKILRCLLIRNNSL